MGTLIKLEIDEIPEVMFVGKEIKHNRNAMAEGDNPIPAFWARCFQDGTFQALEAMHSHIYHYGYAGVMLDWDEKYNHFTYVVGMMMKPGADIPRGFVSHTINAAKVAIGWLQGKGASDVGANAYEHTERAVYENGYSCNHMKWCMELFTHPRYTTPDKNGNIIMDYYLPVVYRGEADPSVEEVMKLVLHEDALENALDFASFLRDSGFQMEYNPREYEEGKWTGAIGGIIGNSIGYMSVSTGTDCPAPWTIWLNEYDFDADDSPEDQELKELVWAHVSNCTRCHHNWAHCGGGERTVFGRRFERLCHSPMFFYAPDAHKLEKIKRLLLRIRKSRDSIPQV